MSQQWSKFPGGKFVLEYASQKIGKGKTIKFEVETLDKVRRYDIQFEELLPNGTKITKNLELKNWVGWWDNTLKSQFTKDLGKMQELGDTQWIFNKKGVNQTMESLRENVIKSMKKADGTPIDELEDLFTNPKTLQNIQGTFGELGNLSSANDLVRILEDPNVFDKIFEIVEVVD